MLLNTPWTEVHGLRCAILDLRTSHPDLHFKDPPIASAHWLSFFIRNVHQYQTYWDSRVE